MSGDDARNRILAVAGPIFAEKGFAASTVREICDAAGANVAAVNYYFGDKQRLYLEAVRCARQRRAEEVPMPVWPPGTDAETRLRGFITTMIHRMVGMDDPPWQTQLMLREVIEPTAACQDLVESYFRATFEELLAIIDELSGRELADHERQQLGFSVMGQCLFYRVAGEFAQVLIGGDNLGHEFSPGRLADHITNFTLSGLRSFSPSPGPAPLEQHQ